MKKTWKIHIIPHTHWDKEWYFTKSISNVFLSKNIDKIYDYFLNNREKMYKYVFDSQYSIVDDYCQINKNGEDKIKEMVEADKFVISPWYTQTDTFNVTGESIVRNMLTGIKESDKYGNHMKIAYMPDSFGFNANLPQIFNSFDMKAFIHWRGVKGEQIKDGILNNWVGIDGSEILEYNLFKYGYTCGGNFLYELFHDGYNKKDIKENAKKLFNAIKNDSRNTLEILKGASKNTNNNILFPFGSDQMTFFENLDDVIKELNLLDLENEWIITSYEEYIDLIKTQIDQSKLNTLNSELRYGEFSRVHKTINSGRWDIKKNIKYLEYLIYKVVEPLNVLYERIGGKYNRNLIDKALRYLFECQAHDSAGGCNTDETNDSVIERLKMGIDLMETLSVFIQRQIAFRKKLQTNELLAFNLEPFKGKYNLKMKLFSETQNFKIMDSNSNELIFKVIEQSRIDPKNFEIINQSHLNNFESNNKLVYWTDVIILDVEFEALSLQKLKLIEVKEKLILKINKDNFIENKYFKIIFEDNKINLYDRTRNKNIFNAFEITADYDAGDSYDFSPKSYNQKSISKIKNSTVQILNSNNNSTMEINYTFKIPTSLTDSKPIYQDVKLSIWINDDIIDFDLKMINKGKDIRWRFIVDSLIKSKTAFSDTSFGVIERSYDYEKELEVWKKENWNDYPTDIESVESVVWLEDKKKKTGIFVNGCNEYQIIGKNKEKIAITLFRAYSLIGRKDLLYRPGRASGIEQYPHQTPNANLINKEINISLRVAYNSDKNLVKESKKWCIPTLYYQNQTINNFFAKGQMFVLPTEELNDFEYNKKLISNCPQFNDDLIISAFKFKYDESKIVIRIYNPTKNNIDIKNLSSLKHLNLKEEVINSKEIIKPNEFVTIQL